MPVEALFFVGNQLIATSHTGRIGVWNAVTKHWQVRALASLAASFSGAQTSQTQGGVPFCPTRPGENQGTQQWARSSGGVGWGMIKAKGGSRRPSWLT